MLSTVCDYYVTTDQSNNTTCYLVTVVVHEDESQKWNMLLTELEQKAVTTRGYIFNQLNIYWN